MPGALGAMKVPSFGADIDMSALGDAGPVLQDGFKDLSAGFSNPMNFKDVSSAGDFVGNIDGFREKVSGLNIGDMAEPAQKAVGTMASKFQMFADKAIEMIPNEQVRELVRPAVAKLMEALGQ